MNEVNNTKKKITLRMVFKYFLRKSKPYKWLILLNIIGVLIVSFVGLILPIYQTKLVDVFAMAGIEKQEMVSMLLHLLVIIGGLDLLQVAGWRLIGFPIIRYELAAIKDIYEECFQYIHRHSYRFFANNLSGSLIKKITKLAGSYELVMDILVFQILQIVIFVPMTIFILMRENFVIGCIFLCFVVLYTGLQILFFMITKKYEIEANEWNSKTVGELSDTIINSFNVLIFASLPYEFKRFRETLVGWSKTRGKQWTLSEWCFCCSSVLTWIFGIGAIYFSIRAWGAGLIQAGVVILIQLYVMKITNQLSNVRHILKSMSRALGESTEMLEILETPHEIVDLTDKKLKISSGKIAFENVCFNYEDGKQVFDGLDLAIKPGEKVAIVGASGSGKTTLVKLLFRFFDIQGGKILIDGEDISQVTQDSLRSQLSMVPQDPVLFHRTIKENIAYGSKNVTDEQIIAAAKMAKCHDFITKLKDGYDSYVGERGVKLSGGERQRIAIARAILENKKILVMDEATSSLDSESEKYIQNAMDEVMKNKTCIVIAHRLSTIVKMDKIIVMDQGKIIEKGSHNALIANKDGIYHRLWSIQSGGFLVSDEKEENTSNEEEE